MLRGKLQREVTYARSMYGGVPAERIDQLRREVNEEVIPSIKDAYAAKISGIDPSTFGYAINPLARANYAGARARTVFTSDEAMSLFSETGFQVALMWAGSVSFAKPHLEASAKIANKEFKQMFSTVAAQGGTTAFRSFTASNFRTNLGRLTGNIPANSQAHHVFPKKVSIYI